MYTVRRPDRFKSKYPNLFFGLRPFTLRQPIFGVLRTARGSALRGEGREAPKYRTRQFFRVGPGVCESRTGWTGLASCIADGSLGGWLG